MDKPFDLAILERLSPYRQKTYVLYLTHLEQDHGERNPCHSMTSNIVWHNTTIPSKSTESTNHSLSGCYQDTSNSVFPKWNNLFPSSLEIYPLSFISSPVNESITYPETLRTQLKQWFFKKLSLWLSLPLLPMSRLSYNYPVCSKGTWYIPIMYGTYHTV